ncbi:3-isopropylmalate dehydratase [Thermodesulfobacteriota bacterium]
MTVICGRVWKFGDAIDTDIIIPARHLVLPLEEMKYKAMEPLHPEFANRVSKDDVIVAGRNFGCGSSREQAPAVLRELGICAIVAISFARIFFRNAINLGIPVVECEEIYEQVREGDSIEIHLSSGEMCIPERGLGFSGSKLPDFLLEVINDGGLIPHLAAKRRTASQDIQPST